MGVVVAVTLVSRGHAKPVSLLDPSFDVGAGPDGAVTDVTLQIDGKVLISGGFTEVAGAPRPGIARLNPDGTLDAAFNPEIEKTGFSGARILGVQQDGKIVLIGDFKAVGGVARNGVARLTVDGSLDAGFVPPPGDWNKGLLHPDGKIVLLSYGHPDPFSNVVDYDLTRIDSDATPEPAFKRSKMTITGAGFYIDKLLSQPDGKILVLIARNFAIAGGPDAPVLEGVSRRLMARLNSDGSLDAAFDPGPQFSAANANDPVQINAVLVQPDGKMVIAGYFKSFDGKARDYLLRLNAAGSLDHDFAYTGPSLAGRIGTMTLDADGKILAGGSGTILRLNPDASVDERFDSSGSNFMDYVFSD